MRKKREGPGRDDWSDSRFGSEEEGYQGRDSKRAPKTRQQIVRRRIIVLASVCAAALVLLALYLNFVRPPEIGPGDTVQPGEPAGEDGVEPEALSGRKDGWYTFLLCGVDDDNGGGDTIMIAAFDTVNQKINIVSIPRDTMVNVAWSTKKINSAYNAGGIERLKEEISKLIGFSVDFYVKVDLKGFVDLVDAIGGVDFDVPFDMNYDDPTQNLHIHIKKGLKTLDGEDAIGVVRWRKNNNGTGYSSGDIGRIGTQQAFLGELAKQIFTIGNLAKVPEFAGIFSKYVESDLSKGNLVWLGQKVMGVKRENIQFFTMPGDYTVSYYTMKTGRYVSYVTLDIDEVIALVNSYFNPYNSPVTARMLDIMSKNRDGSLSSSRGVLQDPAVAVPPTIPSSAVAEEPIISAGEDVQEEVPADTGTPADAETPLEEGVPEGTDTGNTENTDTAQNTENPGDTASEPVTGTPPVSPAE